MTKDNLLQPNTILIVDDEHINRYMMSKVFDKQYKILQAENGEEALAVMRESKQHIAAVVLDLMMPVMDGFGVLEGMAADEELKQIPVVVVTASGEDVSQIRALDLGAQDVIMKPYKPEIVKHRVQNIIERRGAEKAAAEYRIYEILLRQARIDERTGIYTKQAFCSRVEEIIKANPDKNYILCRWDIDRFKMYNDTFGVDAGDALLAKIGALFRENKNAGMLAYGRLEADHFAVLFEDGIISDDKITSQLEDVIATLTTEFNLVVRIGLYPITDRSLDISLMCDRALLALKSTKSNSTKHIARYDESMRQNLVEEQQLIDDLDRALENEEFVIYLQPQYDYDTNTIIGSEALVRWQHPTRGFLAPYKFVPLFERNGFIWRMDEYVWEHACKLMRKWLDEGFNVPPISVNISRNDLYGTHPVEVISGFIKKYNLEPSMLHLEVTESAFMQNPEKLVETIDDMKANGFHVEMDDFGSGYSSLNTLKEVFVDTLKMDMKFLDASGNDSRAGQILSSVIRMANWLNLSVIAEGVETKEHADYLKSLGCTYMQGYYFAKPMPSDAFRELIAKTNTVRGPRAAMEKKVEGSIDFLNASTQATLMFNSFVGGAQIIELDGENIEVLRVNDQFFEAIGANRASYMENMKHLQRRFYPESREMLLNTLNRAVETEQEQSCELHSLPTEHGKDFWTFVRARYLASNGGRHVFYLSVENITERKENDVIRARLDDVIHNVPAGIGIYEQKNDTLYPLFVSDNTVSMFGYTREEYDALIAAGEPINLHYPKHLLRDGETMEPESREFTMQATRKDGSHFVVRIVSNFIPQKDGNPMIYATLIDITKQYEAQSEANLLMKSMPAGIIRYSADDGDSITFASDNFLDLLECSRSEFEQLYKNKVSGFVYKGDYERILGEINEQIKGIGHQAVIEYRVVTVSGKLKWVHAIGHLTEDIQGKRWFYVIIVDLENRKQLESELAEKTIQNEALIKNAPGGVVMFKAEGDKIVREYMSDGVARILGCEPSELWSMFSDEKLYGRVHPDDVDIIEATMTAVIKSPAPFMVQYRLQRADGSYIHVSLTGNPAEGVDGKTHFYCVYNDISNQVKQGELLRAEKQKVEYAIRGAKMVTWEYDIAKHLHRRLDDTNSALPKEYPNAPESLIRDNMIAPQSAEDYRALHRAVESGQETATSDIMLYRAESGTYELRRLTYWTIFSEGKPVSAIGTAIDVSAETEAKARRREFEMALDASSLYLWTFDLKRQTYPIINRSAASLGIGRERDGILLGLRDSDCVAEDGREVMKGIYEKLRFNPYGENDGHALVHMIREKCGIEWLSLSYATIKDDSGEPVSLSFVGEDFTAAHENETLYSEALEGVDFNAPDAPLVRILVDLTDDKVEHGKGTFVEQSMSYSAITARLLSVVFRNDQREQLKELISREALLAAFRAGKTSLSMDFQRYVNDNMVPRWVRLTVRLFKDAKTGNLKSLQVTTDIDEEVINREIASVVAKHSFELLGMIYLSSGYLHCYHHSSFEAGMDVGIDCDYPEGVVEFITRYIREDMREEAQKALDLDAIEARLATEDVFTYVFPVVMNGQTSYKRWRFCWLNSNKQAIAVSRTDVTDAQLQIERNKELKRELLGEKDFDELLRKENLLQIAAEENAIILRQSGKKAFRYDIQRDTAENMLISEPVFGIEGKMPDFSKTMVESGIIAQESIQAHNAFIAELRSGKPSGSCDAALILNGSKGWYHADYAVIFEEGEPAHAIISFFNDSQLKEKELAYRSWTAHVEAIVGRNAPYIEANVTKDYIERHENLRIDYNFEQHTKLSDYFDYASQTVVLPEYKKSFLEFFNIERMLKRFEAGETTGSTLYMAKFGADMAPIWYNAQVQMIKYPYTNDVKVYIIFNDVSEAQENEIKAERASIDFLTGILSREALEERVNETLNNVKLTDCSALFMIDLDNFKKINDSMGHVNGDEALKRVAATIKAVIREQDLVGRVGGDEFVAFMSGGITPEAAKEKAEKLVEALRFTVGDTQLTASVGVALTTGKGLSYLNLYQLADRAMYTAKRNGKDAYIL